MLHLDSWGCRWHWNIQYKCTHRTQHCIGIHTGLKDFGNRVRSQAQAGLTSKKHGQYIPHPYKADKVDRSQSNKGKPWPFLYRCTWDVINTVNEKRVKFLFVSVKLRCNITMTAFQWVKKTHWVHSNVLDKCVNYTLFTLTVILIKCIVNDQSQPMMQRIEILETEFWRLYFEMVR